MMKLLRRIYFRWIVFENKLQLSSFIVTMNACCNTWMMFSSGYIVINWMPASMSMTCLKWGWLGKFLSDIRTTFFNSTKPIFSFSMCMGLISLRFQMQIEIFSFQKVYNFQSIWIFLLFLRSKFVLNEMSLPPELTIVFLVVNDPSRILRPFSRCYCLQLVSLPLSYNPTILMCRKYAFCSLQK